MDSKTHWSNIYQSKSAQEMSWYQLRPRTSLSLIEKSNLGTEANIIDVGAGASTLADHLLALDYCNLTLLDISSEALETVQRRTKHLSHEATLISANLLDVELESAKYDLWHDRAVFHFLTDTEQQDRYIEQVRHALKPGGALIIATFAADGPTKCSGLDVVRYSKESLLETFGKGFKLVATEREDHITPSDAIQKFLYCLLRFVG